MINTKLILASVAFIGAIGTAFATKPMSQRDLWQKHTSGGTTTCDIISCSQTNRGVGTCSISGTKYSDANCTVTFTGTAFAVQNP